MTNHEYTKTKTVQNKKLAADSVTLQKQKPKTKIHIPVLLHEVLEYLNPKIGDTYLDLTAGYGGHSGAILEVTQNPTGTTLVDRDMNAVQAIQKGLPNVTVINSDSASYLGRSAEYFDLILADIGVSSPHLDQSSRGFSYMSDGPLDMRMDQSQELTAETVVNTYSEADIADILYKYGEERRSRQVASAIVKNRPIKSTKQLADVISKVLGRKKSKHPESKSFQAMRIFVNDELKQLETMLELAPKRLNPGGKLAIISFHSLEDRLVKNAFKALGQETLDSEYTLVNKKPISPSKDETVYNPRARSAKLRVLQRK